MSHEAYGAGYGDQDLTGAGDDGGDAEPVFDTAAEGATLMTDAGVVPDVSVVLTTSQAGALAKLTIDSVLAQTLTNFELIIVDDCSKDATLAIVRGYDDARVRLFATPEPLGLAGARNQAMGLVRGRYIAALSQGDVCSPERLALQTAYMDAHPDTVVLGTATTIVREDKQLPDRYPAHTTPGLVWWLLHVMNPLAWSSVMLRTEAVRGLDTFARDEFPLAEDYELYHRLGLVGVIARLDAPLVTRRWQEPEDARLRELRMIGSAAKVLARAYEPWFGPTSHAYAELMVMHVAAARPVPEASTLDRIAAVLSAIERAFTATYAPDSQTRALMAAEMSRLWWGVVRVAIRSGTVSQARALEHRPSFAAEDGLTPKDLFRSGLIGTIRARRGT
jgi:hypothetical protein